MRLIVGRVGRAHGVRGDVAVVVRSDEPELRFQPGCVVYLGSADEDDDPAAAAALDVLQQRWHNGRLLVRFAGHEDRSEAELLQGRLLYAERDGPPAGRSADEWYDYELVGLTVVTAQDPQRAVGRVTAVQHLPAQDLLAVATEQGERLVPLVAELVVELDLGAGVVVVADRPGLLHEDPASGGGS